MTRKRFVPGQMVILAKHCLLTGHYFEPCKQYRGKVYVKKTGSKTGESAFLYKTVCLREYAFLYGFTWCRKTLVEMFQCVREFKHENCQVETTFPFVLSSVCFPLLQRFPF